MSWKNVVPVQVARRREYRQTTVLQCYADVKTLRSETVRA